MTFGKELEKAEQERQAAVIRAEGEAEAANTISAALNKAGDAFVQFRKIEASREIGESSCLTLPLSLSGVWLAMGSLQMRLAAVERGDPVRSAEDGRRSRVVVKKHGSRRITLHAQTAPSSTLRCCANCEFEAYGGAAANRSASSLSNSRNVSYVPSSSGNLLINVPPQQQA
jgi:hypothetical protein